MTQKKITALQTKAKKITDKLNEEVVIATKGIQHIQVQTGIVYHISSNIIKSAIFSGQGNYAR
jgi:uncharacterized iron-regulated protein